MAEFASFWFGSELTAYEYLCILSFVRAGHRFQLFTYEEALTVPEGCHVRSAAEILPKDRVFFYSGRASSKVSAFSNMFRYKLIHETGLCWVDTDVLCLSEDFEERPYIFARQDEEFYNGAILKFPAGHEAMRLATEYCWEVRETAQWGDLGPRLMTRIVTEYGLASEASATHVLYPLHWREVMSLFDPDACQWVSRRVEGARTLHLWNEILGRKNIDKNAMPPASSFLAAVIERLEASRFFDRAGAHGCLRRAPDSMPAS